jgi:aminoglycoside phosphotransferase (APT) family kinase protein
LLVGAARKPGRLIASGRDGDIFEYGPGLVLRRTKTSRSLAPEARILAYVGERGFPVPAVHELRANDTELVLERVDGPLMVYMAAKPWMSSRAMRVLADLHDRLHAIEAPEWLAVFLNPGPVPGRVVHLDLHPLNVILSPTRGPVVIDWTNARAGDPLCDVALTYALMMCGRIPGPRWISRLAQPLRTVLVGDPFVSRYDGAALWQWIAAMAELKALDPRMYPDEVHALRRLAERARDSAPRRAS